MAVIAVDVDETIVDVLPTWNKWCAAFFGKVYLGDEYDLTKIYGKEAMTFWSTPFLYQKLTPRQDAIEYLSKLNDDGYEIGFVTYCKKAQLSSKCKMIKQYFPFYKFIQATKEKGYTSCNYFIDDRVKYLMQQNRNLVKCIRIDTPYTQDFDGLGNDSFPVAKDWAEIYKMINKMEEGEINVTRLVHM